MLFICHFYSVTSKVVHSDYCFFKKKFSDFFFFNSVIQLCLWKDLLLVIKDGLIDEYWNQHLTAAIVRLSLGLVYLN